MKKSYNVSCNNDYECKSGLFCILNNQSGIKYCQCNSNEWLNLLTNSCGKI